MTHRRLSAHPPSEKVKALAASLQGTCKGAVDEIEELTVEEARQFDDLVFNCCSCGWWFPSSDRYEVEDEFCCCECAA